MSTTLQGTTWFPARGLDLARPAHRVPMDMASDGYDFIIENNSLLSKRDGYARVNSIPVSASATIIGCHSLYLSNGINYELIVSSSGTVYTDVGGTVTASALAGIYANEPIDYTQFLDTGIFANGSTRCYTWSGTASGQLTASSPSSVISVATHLNKLFLAIKGTSQFIYGGTGSLTTWSGTGTDTINVDQNNGQTIVGLRPYSRNELIIFKERSMYKLVGETSTNFTLIKIDESIGCVAIKAAKNYRSTASGGIFIWPFRDGLYVYDGTTPKKISSYIQPFWDTLNKSRFKWMDATIDNDNGRYLLTCSVGSSTVHTRIICVDMLNPWTDENGLHFPISIWRLPAESMNTEINATTNAQRLVFGEVLGRKSYFSNALYGDAGNAIDTYCVTPLMPFDGSIGSENCLRRIYGSYKTSGGTMGVYTSTVDGSNYTLLNEIDLTSALGVYSIGIDFQIGVSPIGVSDSTTFSRTNASIRGEKIKVKFDNNNATYDFGIQSPVEFYYKSGGLRA